MAFSFKMLLGGAKAAKACYSKVSELLNNRTPLHLRLSFSGISPTFRVTITNKTANLPLHVHAVRVHYGNKTFSRAFKLHPSQSVMIGPKEKCEWELSFEPFKTILVERSTHDGPPPVSPPDSQPGIENPGQLFNAIGMGEPQDSWIEVDFNEYTDREFSRGDVKGTFDAVGRQHRELRKMGIGGRS